MFISALSSAQNPNSFDPQLGGLLDRTDLYKHIETFDGVNQWDALTKVTDTNPRESVLINIDDLDGQGQGDYTN